MYQIDWNYSDEISLDLEEYETDRPPRRSKRGMLASYYHRKHVLSLYGHSEEEMKAAKKAVSKAKQQRYVTKYFLPVMMVEDAITSAGIKTKRLISKEKKEEKLKEKDLLKQFTTCSSRRSSV